MPTKKSAKPKPPRRQALIFRQSDVERCIRAARAENLPIGSVEVDPKTGKIRIIQGTSTQTENEWDKAV